MDVMVLFNFGLFNLLCKIVLRFFINFFIMGCFFVVICMWLIVVFVVCLNWVISIFFDVFLFKVWVINMVFFIIGFIVEVDKLIMRVRR